MSVEHIKALDAQRETVKARAKRVNDLRRSWVGETELTAEQLRDAHKKLKSDYLARQQRRGATA